MPATVIMLKGLPASGKSTKALDLLKKYGKGNAHRFNSDDMRESLDGGEWSPQNEKFVNKVRDFIVREALAEGKHVIVDNCNLAPKHEANLRDIAKRHRAEFEVIDLTDVSPEECIKRDLKRARSVGRDVIMSMYNQLLRKTETPNDDPTLPPCIIVDIDGTVAQMNGRSPYDWHRVGEDNCREIVWAAVLGLQAQTKSEIIFVSGRDEICRAGTCGWLAVNLNSAHRKLFMRPKDDMRKDYIVKREIYESSIKDNYRVVAVMDDRPAVIALWQDLGFSDRIFNVGTGEEF